MPRLWEPGVICNDDDVVVFGETKPRLPQDAIPVLLTFPRIRWFVGRRPSVRLRRGAIVEYCDLLNHIVKLVKPGIECFRTSSAQVTPLAMLGGLALWLLRLALAPASTLAGFRRWVIEECPVAPGRRLAAGRPVPAIPAAPRQGRREPTKRHEDGPVPRSGHRAPWCPRRRARRRRVANQHRAGARDRAARGIGQNALPGVPGVGLRTPDEFVEVPRVIAERSGRGRRSSWWAM